MNEIADIFDLSDEVGPCRSGWAGVMLEVRVMAGVLLDLTGEAVLVGEERGLCEGVMEDGVIQVKEAVAVRELYEAREREAMLRGEVWEGGGL